MKCDVAETKLDFYRQQAAGVTISAFQRIVLFHHSLNAGRGVKLRVVSQF